MDFKLGVVERVEKGEMTYMQAQNHVGIQGKSTVLVWLRKHGKLDWSKPLQHILILKSKETSSEKIERFGCELVQANEKNQLLKA